MLDLMTRGESSSVLREVSRELTGEPSYVSFEGTATATVAGEVVVDNEPVPMSINHDSNRSVLDVMWEDGGYKNYKRMGLYGRMNTDYQRVTSTESRSFHVDGGSYQLQVKY